MSVQNELNIEQEKKVSITTELERLKTRQQEVLSLQNIRNEEHNRLRRCCKSCNFKIFKLCF